MKDDEQDFSEAMDTEEELPSKSSEESLEEPTVELEGEMIPLSQVSEWKKGYLRQADYTQKTQRLAAREKELETLIQLAEFLDTNPTVAQGMIDYLNSLGGKGKAKESTEPNEVLTRLQRIESTFTQMQEQADDEALDAEIQELKKKYPDFNEDAVLEAAEELEIPDLEAVYLKLNREKLKEKMKAEVQKELAETAKRKVSIEASAGGSMRTPVKKDITGKSYDELAEEVLKEV